MKYGIVGVIMNKQDIYKYLNDKKVWYEITEHMAVYNMNDLSKVDFPYKEGDAKNLFVRDDKKNHYYLITVKGNKRLDLKKFRTQNNTRPLSFASEDDLFHILKLLPGAVTPLGVLNDDNLKVEVFIDIDFMHEPGIIGVHPCDNTATVWLKVSDLIEVIKEHGNTVNVVKIKDYR